MNNKNSPILNAERPSPLQIDWSKRPISQWRALMRRVPRSSWLQSLPFGKACEVHDHKRTRLGVIIRDDEPVGMLAVQEIKLGPVRAVDLWRGPLWFSSNPGIETLAAFAQVFAKEYPKGILRRRRWLPEWRDPREAQAALAAAGFKPVGKSYETLWLDLTRSLDQLRSDLKHKWRNALSKGERSQLSCVPDWGGETVELFLKFWDLHKKLKKFPGRSADFLREEIRAALTLKDTVILWAHADLLPVAAVLIVIHGRSASYRASFSTDEGRARNAHNFLLWRAVETLKEWGVRDFDLGGLEPTGGEGLTRFKEGMGGEPMRLPGLWR